MLLGQGLPYANSEEFEYSYAYFLRHKDQLVDELTSQGARVHCFDVGSSVGVLASTPAAIRHIRTERPDLIHCHLPLAGVVGRLLRAHGWRGQGFTTTPCSLSAFGCSEVPEAG